MAGDEERETNQITRLPGYFRVCRREPLVLTEWKRRSLGGSKQKSDTI